MDVLMQYLRSRKIYNLTHIIKNNHNKKTELSNATLIVVRNSTRTNSNGTRIFNNSAPCTTCRKYLQIHGIGTVKYSDHINGKNVLVSLRLNIDA